MPKVSFENGMTVNFDSMPSQKDIEEVSSNFSPRQTLNMPEEKSIFDVAKEESGKGFNYMGQRAKGLLQGAGQAISHPKETGKGIFYLGMAAAQASPGTMGSALRLLPGAQKRNQDLVDYGKDTYNSIKDDPVGLATDTALTAGAGLFGGRLLGATGKGIKAGLKENKIGREEYASRLNNSLIGAKGKDLDFSEPGLGMAKEGITGNHLRKVEPKVSKNLEVLSDRLTDAYAKNDTVINNTLPAFKPLAEALTELRKAPGNNSAAITKLETIIRDITGESTGKPRQFYMRPAEIRELKQFIAKFAKFDSTSGADEVIKKTLRKVYHGLDDIVDKALPQTKELNKRVSDLIEAKGLIQEQMQRNLVKEPMPSNFFDVANAPFKFLKSPRVKTNLASFLTGKYPKNFNTEVKGKPFIKSDSPGNLLRNPTRLLPNLSAEKSGIKPGQRESYSGFKTTAAPSAKEGVINLPDKSMGSVARKARESVSDFKKSKYVEDIKSRKVSQKELIDLERKKAVYDVQIKRFKKPNPTKEQLENLENAKEQSRLLAEKIKNLRDKNESRTSKKN